MDRRLKYQVISSSFLSTLLLKPCHKKQENYNENLAANFVDDQLDICKYNEFDRKQSSF